MFENIFYELSLIIVIATLVAAFARLLKQPLIIGYIFAGIVIGSGLFTISVSEGVIETFADIGVAILLFMVGLNLNPKVIKDVGKVAVITGVGQVIFTSLGGFLIALAMGFSPIASIYIAVALTFSSTIIIMKLISDKGDLETLYGKISIGFLLVQDIIAVFALMIISSLSGGGDIFTLIITSILKVIALLAVVFYFSLFLLPAFTKRIAKSQEFLLLFSLCWCLALATVFSVFGFSIEIGALLAGITLAASPYRFEINSKMKPLRDFFLVLFFIVLGSQMIFSDITPYIPQIIIFSAFILIGNPIIVMLLMKFLRYTKRTSFKAGLTVAQISEFSLILIALGVRVGHIPTHILSVVTVVGLITITGSTYMILYSDKIYNRISKYLGIFEYKGKKIDEQKLESSEGYEAILFGYNRIGYDLLESLKGIKKKHLVVDYNPDTINKLTKEGVQCRYGDANDLELLNDLNFRKAKMVISTVPDFETNTLLIKHIRETSKKAIIIVVSLQIDEALQLYGTGADYVLMPHFLGGHHASTIIGKYRFSHAKFQQEKQKQLQYLKKRKEQKHEHPVHEKNHN